MSNNETFSHWRDSARIPRFFIVDARASLLVIIFFLRPSWITFGLAVSFIILLAILDYFKIPLTVALRIAKNFVSGSYKARIPR